MGNRQRSSGASAAAGAALAALRTGWLAAMVLLFGAWVGNQSFRWGRKRRVSISGLWFAPVNCAIG